MFAFRALSWRRSHQVGAGFLRDASLTDVSSGIVAGTQVSTRLGWCDIETVIPGDEVLTCDADMQPIAAVERSAIRTDGAATVQDDWPVLIPADALGNLDPMLLLPRQSVMVRSAAAKTLFGQSLALVPAAALVGFRGIRRVAPPDTLELVTLIFAQDQVVYANAGGLLSCPNTREVHDAPSRAYETLTDNHSALLVDAMKLQDVAPGGEMAAA